MRQLFATLLTVKVASLVQEATYVEQPLSCSKAAQGSDVQSQPFTLLSTAFGGNSNQNHSARSTSFRRSKRSETQHAGALDFISARTCISVAPMAQRLLRESGEQILMICTGWNVRRQHHLETASRRSSRWLSEVKENYSFQPISHWPRAA